MHKENMYEKGLVSWMKYYKDSQLSLTSVVRIITARLLVLTSTRELRERLPVNPNCPVRIKDFQQLIPSFSKH